MTKPEMSVSRLGTLVVQTCGDDTFLTRNGATMNWTTEKPTQPGFYWMKRDHDDTPDIFELDDNCDIAYPCGSEVPLWMNEPPSQMRDMLSGNELWYGPLEPPPLEKEQP